jgi:hypothetical protein
MPQTRFSKRPIALKRGKFALRQSVARFLEVFIIEKTKAKELTSWQFAKFLFSQQ